MLKLNTDYNQFINSPNNYLITTELKVVPKSEWTKRGIFRKIADWFNGISCDKVEIAKKLFIKTTLLNDRTIINKMKTVMQSFKEKIARKSTKTANDRLAISWIDKTLKRIAENI